MNKSRLIGIATLITLLAPTHTFAFVPLICDLCAVWVVAGLGVSRYFGIDDTVSGVWIGAMIVALVSGTIAYCEKKNWNFRFRNPILALTVIGFSYGSLYGVGVLGAYRNTLFNSTSFFADKILISSIVGGLVLTASSSLYQWMKKKNGGHAHFPFEKVVLPLTALALASAGFHFTLVK